MSRYREIAAAFSRNGLGFIVKELGMDRVFSLPRRLYVRRDQETTKSIGVRVRQFLEELGPTFIKIGQMASTRPDLIPEDIMDELSYLQDEIAPFPLEDVQKIVKKELKADLYDLFEEFDPSPIGVASIGQVHKAVLNSGEHVAVKVQRPLVEKQIHTDLEIIYELAIRAEKKFNWAVNYQVTEVVNEFSKAIKDELDYITEGRNADLMAKQFEEDSSVRIPKIYWDYTTEKVLTMEFIEGIKLDEVAELEENGHNLESLASQLANAIFYQIFKDGYFHGDPHIGNILALSDKNIGLIDFGLMGRLSPEMKTHLASLVLAMVKQDSDKVIKTITKMGITPDDVSLHELRGDIDQLIIKYYDVPDNEFSLGQSITDIFSIAHKHQITIATDLTMVGKTLLTLEGVLDQLDPNFNIVEAAEPFGRELIREKYNPKRLAENFVDQLDEYGEIIEDMPKIVKELSIAAKKRKIPVEISVPKADNFLSKLDTVSNRLSFSIVLLSFSLIMVGLIIGSALGRQQSSLLWNVPAIEIGFVIAMLMFAWLIYSIFRSGRF
ncbi:AarF/ABC1/UbiB kinase family protein [Filobacillus milosensis]|uniref:AarF/ABC1/UbiB kinase family protein n=2 Tax=Filobacillus milosensis TaxID=94137 RepID=A0A4Y8IER7_9BACI|nr:AarF/ABC1/UbiB kinase family protein [Filobacillus milosensis]